MGIVFVGHDGRRVAVAELYDTGQYERVYNLAIRSFHTYFVCDESWPCSVWAHNACDITKDISKIGRPGKQGHVRVVKSKEELLDIFNKYAQGGVEVPLTAAHRAQKIQRMVDVTDTSRGTMRLVLRESRSGGKAIDIMVEKLVGAGDFTKWRTIHIG
jgi:hypothetical protein